MKEESAIATKEGPSSLSPDAKAFIELEPERAALRADRLRPLNVNVWEVAARAQSATNRIRPLLPELRAAFPTLALDKIERLEM